MQDAFGSVVAFILLCIMLFFAPTLYLAVRQDNIIQNKVNYETADFVNSIKNSGNITKRTYEDFLKNLDRTGNIYEIKMQHIHKVVNPMTDDNGTLILDENEEVKSSISYYSTYESDILKELYEGRGTYHLNKEDYISVKVVNRNQTLGTQIQRLFIGSGVPKEKIFVTFGGVIRDET